MKQTKPDLLSESVSSFKPLERIIHKDGFILEQIRREGMIALYKQYKATSPSISYELIRIKTHNGYKIKNGKKAEDGSFEDLFIPPSEMYPNSEAWGTNGWTLTTEEQANERFEKLVKEETETELAAKAE